METFSDIVILYGPEDSAVFAKGLHNMLWEREIRAWYDQSEVSGDMLVDSLLHPAKNGQKAVLAIFSPGALTYPGFIESLEAALNNQTPTLALVTTNNWPNPEALNQWKLRLPNVSWLDAAPVVRSLQSEEPDLAQLQELTDNILDKLPDLPVMTEQKSPANTGQPPTIKSVTLTETEPPKNKALKTSYKDVFISYGRRESSSIARKLYNQLSANNIDAWFDVVNIPDGDDFQQRIDHGIESAHNFVFIISPHAIVSKYCRLELDMAQKLGKRIIPIYHVHPYKNIEWRIDEENRLLTPNDIWEMRHPSILMPNYVLMRQQPDDQKPTEAWADIDDFNDAFNRLINLIKKNEDYVYRHTDLLAKALRWQSTQKDEGQLLIGKEREQATKWLLTRFLDEEQQPCVPTDLHGEFIAESRKNSENKLTDVFIAYAAESEAREQGQKLRLEIVRALEKEGITCWVHDRDISKGENFESAILRGVEQADNLLFFISPESGQSEWCLRELGHALQHHKRIIPMLVAPTDTQDMPDAIKNLQYIDFTDNNDQRKLQGVRDRSDFRQDIDELVRQIRKDQSYIRQHKTLLVQALRWKEIDNNSLLLRGYELKNARLFLKSGSNRKEQKPTELHHQLIAESEQLNAKNELRTDVFISYSRNDSSFARRLNIYLQNNGKNTWFDQENIAAGSADFALEINNGIQEADNFLFVISPKSVASPYCQEEVDYATAKGKRIITLLWEPLEDLAVLPDALRNIQWIDFKSQPFERACAQLLEAISQDADYVQMHTKVGQKAGEWLRSALNNDFLLSQSEYEEAMAWRATAADYRYPSITAEQQAFMDASQLYLQKQRQRFIFTVAGVFAAFLLTVGVFLYINYEKGKKIGLQEIVLYSLDPLMQQDLSVRLAYEGYMRTSPKPPYVIKALHNVLKDYRQNTDLPLPPETYHFYRHNNAGGIRYAPDQSLVTTLTNQNLNYNSYLQELDGLSSDGFKQGLTNSLMRDNFDTAVSDSAVILKVWPQNTQSALAVLTVEKLKSKLPGAIFDDQMYDETELAGTLLEDAYFGLNWGTGYRDIILQFREPVQFADGRSARFMVWNFEEDAIYIEPYGIDASFVKISEDHENFLVIRKEKTGYESWHIDRQTQQPTYQGMLPLTNVGLHTSSKEGKILAVASADTIGVVYIAPLQDFNNYTRISVDEAIYAMNLFSYKGEQHLLTLTATAAQVWRAKDGSQLAKTVVPENMVYGLGYSYGNHYQDANHKENIHGQAAPGYNIKVTATLEGPYITTEVGVLHFNVFTGKIHLLIWNEYRHLTTVANTGTYLVSVDKEQKFYMYAVPTDSVFEELPQSGWMLPAMPISISFSASAEFMLVNTIPESDDSFENKLADGAQLLLYRMESETPAEEALEAFTKIENAAFVPGEDIIRGITNHGVIEWLPEPFLRELLTTNSNQYAHLVPQLFFGDHYLLGVIFLGISFLFFFGRHGLLVHRLLNEGKRTQISVYSICLLVLFAFLLFENSNTFYEYAPFVNLFYLLSGFVLLSLIDIFINSLAVPLWARLSQSVLAVMSVVALVFFTKDFMPLVKDIAWLEQLSGNQQYLKYIDPEIFDSYFTEIFDLYLGMAFIFLPIYIAMQLFGSKKKAAAFATFALPLWLLAMAGAILANTDLAVSGMLMLFILFHFERLSAMLAQKRMVQFALEALAYTISFLLTFIFIEEGSAILSLLVGINLLWVSAGYLRNRSRFDWPKAAQAMALGSLLLVLANIYLVAVSASKTDTVIFAIITLVFIIFYYHIPWRMAAKAYYNNHTSQFVGWLLSPLYVWLFFLSTLVLAVPIWSLVGKKMHQSPKKRLLLQVFIGFIFILFFIISFGVIELGLFFFALVLLVDVFLLFGRRKYLSASLNRELSDIWSYLWPNGKVVIPLAENPLPKEDAIPEEIPDIKLAG